MTTAAPAFANVARVNLMPRSEIVRRERDKLVRRWVWIVLGSILVAVLVIAAALGFRFLADQRLAAEQAQTNALLSEISTLSEVSAAIATEAELTDYRALAMATDLVWAPVIAKLTSTLPPDTALTGYALAAGGVPTGDDPALEKGLVGTISVDSPTPLDIVAVIRSLRGVEGVLYADGQSVTSSQITQGRFAYLLNVDFDQTVYSGAFAPTAVKGDD
jgi:hypothetical protein